MATTIVRRPQRRPEPPAPTGEILLDTPPEVPRAIGRAWGRLLMFLPMLAGSVAMSLMFAGQRGGTLAYVTGGLFGLSALGMLASQLGSHSGGPGRQEMRAARRDYMAHLSDQRRKVRQNIEKQRVTQFHRNPDPDTLCTMVASRRLWERRANDPDFTWVRIGIGPNDLATPLIPPNVSQPERLDPMCAKALTRFLRTYATVADLPLDMALDGFARIFVAGDRARARAFTRAVIAQAVAFHAPDDLLVAVCSGNGYRDEWEWVKWLPHALHPTRTDALGPQRLVSSSVTGLEAMLEEILANRGRFQPAVEGPATTPHVIVVLDGGDTAGSDHLLAEGGVDAVTVLDLSTPPPRTPDMSGLVLTIGADGSLRSTTYDADEEMGRADALDVSVAEGIALALAPLRLSEITRGEQRPSGTVDFADLLGIADPHTVDLSTMWAPRPQRDRLRVPIGVAPDGMPVDLDLKESAQDGMGPHGLLIGATGSGKSELLRTIVLGLAVTHSSEVLNFVLVDFKGGATFTTLDALPHTSAVITNLADELVLVDRMKDAINGELLRRQEVLRKAGNYASVRDYEKARAAGVPLAPLPSLLIICDEFSELLSARPDFIDMFVQIGRVGRSLGIHLLLASQRLEEGRLRGLDTHLSYRIGLRTFSPMESRIVLGDTIAYELPRSPGHGYLKSGTETPTRFRAAYVSGPYRRDGGYAGTSTDDRVLEYTTHYVAPPITPESVVTTPDPGEESLGESLLTILADQTRGRGAPAHQVWLPPLREPPTLDVLVPGLGEDPVRGLTTSVVEWRGRLSAPVGIVDKPLEQRRDAWWLDLGGSAGHVVIVGGPQSGKSTLLRTIVTSLALCHTPREAQFYCLDFGGGTLSTLTDLPHVGGIATRQEPSAVRRTIAEISLLLAQRERFLAQNRLDMGAYRKRLRDGEIGSDPYGDVLLVIDGWATIRAQFEDLEPVVTDIANRGLTCGIHVIASVGRWMDLRPAIRDVLGTRIELRLGDPGDSILDRKAAVNVPERSPGRGITPDGLQFLAALPRVDGKQEVEDIGAGLATLIDRVRDAWQGPGAPPVRLLPAEIAYDRLPTGGDGRGVPIGIAEVDLGPVWLDFASDQHLLVFGETRCGKSSFLRMLARSIADRHPASAARLLVVDHRRSLLEAVPQGHLAGYGTAGPVTETFVKELSEVLRRRLPGPDITPEQLRTRSWWTGPEVYVLVDDYELVVTGTQNPLAPLLEFLGQARDVGLHVVVARNSGGASRALFEPFIMRLRELGSPGLVMSGDRNEGVLVGNVRPGPLPPGRGWLVTRRDGARLVQVAWSAPPT